MAPESYIDPTEMSIFVNKANGVAIRFENLHDAGGGTDVSRRAFGILPASYRLWDIYQQVSEACNAGLLDAFTAFQEIGIAVSDQRDAYEATEMANRDLYIPKESK